MNGAKLKGKRVEKGYTQTDMANFIEKSFDSYSKKERGEVLFTPKEEAIIAIKLQLSLLEFNEIFLMVTYRTVSWASKNNGKYRRCSQLFKRKLQHFR